MRAYRPSRTAVKVGRIIVWLARQPRLAPLLPQGAAEAMERLLAHAGVLKPWMLRLYEKPWYGRLLTAIERRTVPGQSVEIGLRKRFFDDEARAALEGGARQVLVVGAGLDTLCWRLASAFPEVTFVEVDHPASQGMKRAALETLGPLPPNLHLLGVDLARTSLEVALAGLAAWRKEVPGVVVAEAVLMYLEEAHVVGFLETLGRCTGSGSRLLFSFLSWEEHGKPRFSPRMRWLVEAGLRSAGEPLLWAVRDGDLERLLSRQGFRLAAPPERTDLHRRYLVPAGLPELPVTRLEQVAVAEKP
jgi:methyltransferase (TIGR00027 family)